MEISPLLLCILGLILILLEILVVPGFGFVGIAGFAFLLWGAYRYSQEFNLWVGIGVFALVILVCLSTFVLFLRSPASKWLIHRDQFAGSKIAELVRKGQKGRTLTPLFPVGKAVFVVDGKERMLDVSSSGEFVESNREIEVFLVEGTRIFVKPAYRKAT